MALEKEFGVEYKNYKRKYREKNKVKNDKGAKKRPTEKGNKNLMKIFDTCKILSSGGKIPDSVGSIGPSLLTI